MILLLGVGLSREAEAVLANRVFVSARSGNDANACNSILTPCQTFAGAVMQLNPGGEAIVLDSGGYGAVTVTQAVTIEAPPGVLAFIHPPSGDAITINAGGGDTVVLRGLVLNGGAGNGITVNTVGVLHVENCVISGFAMGLSFQVTGQLFVKDTIVRNNGVAGILLAGSPKASLDRCRLENNLSIGLFIASGFATIRDSVASGNGSGLLAQTFSASPVELNVENCLAANNAVGVGAGGAPSTPGAIIRVSNTTVTDNGTGLEQSGPGTLLSRTNNTVEGNTTNTSGTIGTYAAK